MGGITLAGKVFIVLLLVATICVTIGLFTNGWSTVEMHGQLTSKEEYGLFWYCYRPTYNAHKECHTLKSYDYNDKGWLVGVLGLMVASLLGLLISCAAFAIAATNESITTSKKGFAITMLLCILAGIFLLSASITYGKKFRHMVVGYMAFGEKSWSLNYSFGLTVVASILSLIAGIMVPYAPASEYERLL